MEPTVMERVHRIQSHPMFQQLWQKLQEAEQDRIFCRHTMAHFLDVARLMYIYNLEDGAGLSKDLIYAAALLHDLGRYRQLLCGTPHEIAGAQIAEEILADCGYTEQERLAVRSAILGHRDPGTAGGNDVLAAYLYRADKRSRTCFACPAREACNWPEEKKNLWIDN